MNLYEEIGRIRTIMQVDEMAYPIDFNMDEFKSIRTFTGKLRYAQQHLLGKIGKGSARAVFKIDNDKVIKIAINHKGIAQNEEESEGYKQNYNVLARVFDIDDDYTWLEMEFAKKITPKRFVELVGTTPENVAWWIDGYLHGHKREDLPDLSENEFVNELMNFISDYNYPVPGDFRRISTYGEVLRDGKPKVVVIDFGYSSSVHNIYHKRKQLYRQLYETK